MNGSKFSLEKTLEALDRTQSSHTLVNGVTIPTSNRAIGTHNAELLRYFANEYMGIPTCQSYNTITRKVMKLKAVAVLLGKNLDELTQSDLKNLNIKLKENYQQTASEYRAALKKFLKMLDKEKHRQLIESDFLVGGGITEGASVNAETFWEQDQCDAYLRESKRHSIRQQAFAALWLTTGLRPQEHRVITKSMIVRKDNYLKICVPRVKTKERVVVLLNGEASAVWGNIQPYLLDLQDRDRLFPLSWAGLNKVHQLLAKRAKIPENKDHSLYMARKMILSRWYNEYGLAKASQMAGHVPGSKIMRHYVNLTESQLLEQQSFVRVEQKICPNPICNFENEAHVSQCVRCKSPLDKQAFAAIISRNLDDKINAQLDVIKKEFMIKMLTMQNNTQ